MFRIYKIEKRMDTTVLEDCELTKHNFTTIGEAITQLNQIKKQNEEYTIIQIFK